MKYTLTGTLAKSASNVKCAGHSITTASACLSSSTRAYDDGTHRRHVCVHPTSTINTDRIGHVAHGVAVEFLNNEMDTFRRCGLGELGHKRLFVVASNWQRDVEFRQRVRVDAGVGGQINVGADDDKLKEQTEMYKVKDYGECHNNSKYTCVYV